MGMSPFADLVDLLIKGGGRLRNSDLDFGRKYPTIIPDTLLGDALIGHLHASQLHQGRRITAATIRDQGYCAVGGKQRIQRAIATCTTLRAPQCNRKWRTCRKNDSTEPRHSTSAGLMSLVTFMLSTERLPEVTQGKGKYGYCYLRACTAERFTWKFWTGWIQQHS